MQHEGTPWLDIAGDRGSPAIVLLHASALNRRMWLPVSQALSPSYHVLAPDLPGHGALRTSRFTLPGAVSHVTDLLRRLPAPALLAGDSLGGYVAIAAAAAEPARVGGIVAGGCTLNPVGVLALAFRKQGWQARVTIALRGRSRAAAAGEAALRASHPGAPVDEIVREGLSPGGAADSLLACAGANFEQMLSQCAGPVVLVNGAADRAARRDESRFVAASPRARVATVAGSGHGVSLDHPGWFAGIVAELAREVFPDTTSPVDTAS